LSFSRFYVRSVTDPRYRPDAYRRPVRSTSLVARRRDEVGPQDGRRV